LWFEEVGQFVDDDVFEAFWRLFGEVRIEADAGGGVAATAPFCFHALDEDAGYFPEVDRQPCR
jgi:hypothetical protein